MIAVLIWMATHPAAASHNDASLTLDGGGAVIIAGIITAIATIGAAVIAAGVLLAGYKKQLAITRGQDRDRLHAEAIEAVHAYLEGPYRVRRRDGSAEARMDITRQISDIQVRLRYYETLIKLNSTPEVASAYTALVTVARREAGTPMKVSRDATLCARCSDRRWLKASSPTLSVCPSTITLAFSLPVR